MFERRQYFSRAKFRDEILTLKSFETRRITPEKLQEGWSLQTGVSGRRGT